MPPRLVWDWGTAYDLFMSLRVLYNPTRFGLRAAWAAGVRSRLPTAARDLLEQASACIRVPFHWVHSLPDPKDGATILWSLRQIPLAERLLSLLLRPETPAELSEVVRGVIAKRSWNKADRKALRAAYRHLDESPTKEGLTHILDWCVRPEEFGERYLSALRVYQEVFFAEEEARIRSTLQRALAEAQNMAQRLSLTDLLGELSQGLHLASLPEAPELVLIPSFWSTPLIIYGLASPERAFFMFGARPVDASLVPGEVVPDALVQVFKALSSSTRLRILRYLAVETLTPAQLARRLRLRAPTVTHHLHALRLAGLVHLTLEEGKEQYYAARSERIAETLSALAEFLESQE